MTHTLLVGAAPLPGCEEFYSELLAASTHVVAADAAGEWCVRLGRVPDAVLGDFDGSESGAEQRLRLAGAHVETYPVDKDRTDLEIALEYAVTRWECPIVVTAAFTRRLDHTLAALGVLLRAGAGASVREPGWSAYSCREAEAVQLDLEAGTTVSVVALDGEARITVEGAIWPLSASALPLLSGLGVSNRAAGGPFSARATNGTLAIIVQDRE
jgi:thiamine pyrophosphokinase